MSLKAEIEAWVSALAAYEAEDFEGALGIFDTIADSSKIWFNIGLIHATTGHHGPAICAYKEAIRLDAYLAVASFQSGVSQFLLGRHADALGDFEASFSHMRGNMTIDYGQIGLKFRLHSCEILFNRGLTKVLLGRIADGLSDLDVASEQKQTEEHSVIDEARGRKAQGYTVFSIPVGVIFRPSDLKVKNLQARNYLGKARVVADIESSDTVSSPLGAHKEAINSRERLRRDGKSNKSQNTSKTIRRDPAVPPSSSRASNDYHSSVPRRTSFKSSNGLHPVPVTIANKVDLLATFGDSTNNMHIRSESAPSDVPHRRVSSPRTRSSVGQLARDHPGGDAGTPAQSSPPSSRMLHRSTAVASLEGLTRPLAKLHNSLPDVPKPDSRYSIDGLVDTYSRADDATWEEHPAGEIGKWVSSQDKYASAHAASGGPRSKTSKARDHPVRSDDKGYESAEAARHQGLERIRLKLHYCGDVRGLLVDADLPFTELMQRLLVKFGRSDLRLSFRDEEGACISLVDDTDWECALDMTGASAKGPEGKLIVTVD